jgi:hypothetical protein
VRVICRACEEEQVEGHVEGHFDATVDGSLRLEDHHGWVTCRCGHRIELIRAGLGPLATASPVHRGG